MSEDDERLWLRRSDDGSVEEVVTESERREKKGENEKASKTEEPEESGEGAEAAEDLIWKGRPVLWAFFPFYLIGALAAVTGTIAELAFPLPLWTLGILVFFVAFIVTIPLPLQRAWTFTVTSEEIRQDFSLFVRRSRSAPACEVTDVTAGQGPIGRTFGFGTVRIDTAGTPFPGVRFWGVEDPFAVEKTVRKVVENATEQD